MILIGNFSGLIIIWVIMFEMIIRIVLVNVVKGIKYL